MRKFPLLALTSLLGLLLVWAGRPADPADAQGKTGLVLAHYYAWFDPSSFNGGKTPFTHPAPYFSTDQGIMQQHVQQAQGAGIDGFVQAWYGPDASQQTEPNFGALLNVASGSGFKAAVNFEPISPFMPDNGARIFALQTLLNTHATHPAYLRMDGKPVVFFWATWALTVDDWVAIRNAADPNRNSIWIAEGGNVDYLSVFDGMYLYNIAWSDNPAGINIGQGGNTRAASGTYGAYKYWVGTAMPGFNDSLLGRGSNTIIRDRAGGNFYRSSFSGAVQSNPDLIVITSFNEWPEGSHIEPSNEFGDTYLNLTRELISTYKGGGVPSAAPVQPVAPAPVTGGENGAAAGESGSGETAAQPAPVQQGPAPLPTPREDGRAVYIVQSGDTLIDIAVRYDTLLAEIYRLNGITADSLLSVGQEIVLAGDPVVEPTAVAEVATAIGIAEEAQPTATPQFIDQYPGAEINAEDNSVVHRIATGETLIGVAVRYDIPLERLYELNGIDGSSLLSVGQLIILDYLPTPDVSLRGGSADLPIEIPLATPTDAPTETPLPLPTLTPAPTATTQPTAVASSADVEGVQSSSDVGEGSEVAAVVSAPGGESEADLSIENMTENMTENDTGRNGLSNQAVFLFGFAALLLVITAGLFMIFLSRNRN